MYHPKHWAELDPFTANDNPSFRNILFDGDNRHLRRDGLSNQPTSIRVMTGNDKQAAGEVACRIIRIWNLFRDIPDDELGDVVLIKRSGVKDMAEQFKATMDEIADQIINWEPTGEPN